MHDAGEARPRVTDRSIFRDRVDAAYFGQDPPSFHVDGTECVLTNVSMGGCLVAGPAVLEPLAPKSEVRLTIAMDGQSIYDGTAVMVRNEPFGVGRALALEVTDGFIDLSRLKDLHALISMRRSASSYHSARAKLPAGYRIALESLVDFHRFHRALLAPREELIRVEGARTDDALVSLAAAAKGLMVGPWQELRNAAASAATGYLDDEDALREMKNATERQLTAELMGAPLIERAYRKPLLYAGDFRTMTFVYRNEFEGASVTDRVFHWFVANEPLAEGVRARKDMMKRLVVEEQLRVHSAEGRALRVMSLGCGPALEVRELAHDPNWDGEVTWTLVDQEVRALSIAYGDNFAALRSSGRPRGDIRCMNLALKHILREKWVPAEQQDFIYAAGLFDYLSKDVAVRLINLLAQNLAPGGLIAIGNARQHPTHFWVPEFLLDWRLLYRTEAQMLELAADQAAHFDIELALEPAGAYWFLLMRRR